jgi:hypothetical protein
MHKQFPHNEGILSIFTAKSKEKYPRQSVLIYSQKSPYFQRQKIYSLALGYSEKGFQSGLAMHSFFKKHFELSVNFIYHMSFA